MCWPKASVHFRHAVNGGQSHYIFMWKTSTKNSFLLYYYTVWRLLGCFLTGYLVALNVMNINMLIIVMLQVLTKQIFIRDYQMTKSLLYCRQKLIKTSNRSLFVILRLAPLYGRLFPPTKKRHVYIFFLNFHACLSHTCYVVLRGYSI